MKLAFEQQANGQAAEETMAQPMIRLGDSFVPKFPTELKDVGIDPDIVSGLALKHAYTVPKFNTEWMIRKLCLPLPVVTQLMEGLRDDHMVEVVGHSGPFGFNYAVTNRGREHAHRLLEISGYVGPTPVSLEAYVSALEFQSAQLPDISEEDVEAAVAGTMVLSDHIRQISGLAIMSRRSLFLYGPPGNGKTTLGHLLHNAVKGDIWIPHAIGIENEVIRVYDPECHLPADTEMPADLAMRTDNRWVRTKRPFIVVGGELTIEALDLMFDPTHGYYEAPLHFKANAGTFLLDDFGCQRVEPQELLNRWIHPLERGIDFLTLKTGQQIEVPFRQMLIVSTNMNPERTMSPAFLRRLGYRVFMPNPSREDYAEIFRRYAGKYEAMVSSDVMENLLDRYQSEERPLRSCEPRDLIERMRDICRYRGIDFCVSNENVDVAWKGYFGFDDDDWNDGDGRDRDANGEVNVIRYN